MPTNRAKARFLRAICNDEYAEVEIVDGYYLVTDKEGNGMFYPYIVAHKTPPTDSRDIVGDELARQIEQLFDTEVDYIGWFDQDGGLNGYDIEMSNPL